MRSYIQLLTGIVLLSLVPYTTDGHSLAQQKRDLLKAKYISTDGKTLKKGNPLNSDGNINRVDSPVLHLIRTGSKSPRGTILLLPGGEYKIIKYKNEGEQATGFLNSEGYDVAVLEYHVSDDPDSRNVALADALKAFRLLKTSQKTLGLRGERLCIMGISSGGHLAARTVQNLGENEQPGDLILISPMYLNETIPGTVIPSVMPPVHPAAGLFCTFSDNDNKKWIYSSEQYSKIWRGFDGRAEYKLLSDNAYTSDKDTNPFDSRLKLAGLLGTFLEKEPVAVIARPNPAAIPVEGYSPKRHAEKVALIKNHKYDLLMIGNSITNNLEKPQYQPVWNQFYAPRNAINLGYSGYRTENILWNIQNGELDGQSPKVIVLGIGTNNVDEKNYPTRHTAGQLAGGIEAIVNLLREKCPDAKIIVLRCFPGSYDGPDPTSHRIILNRASEIVSKLADGRHIFYCDVNHVFLNIDGSVNHDMMGDWLHPTPEGASACARAMEPLLSELMGDKSLDTDVPANSAIVPVPKLENDSYDWWARHSEVLRIKDSINPEIVMIGNSITHYWGGIPSRKGVDGKPMNSNGPETWDALFGNYRVLNLGFGWDRTQNVLWRLDHGEIDGLNPRTVIIHIGSNNTSETPNARMNTAPEIVEGIRAICGRVRSKVPGARIILMAVFPREQSAGHPRRILINEINRQLEIFAREQKITLVNIGPKMLEPDGTLSREIASDFCHPTEKGYQIWADAIRQFISESY